jgi:hypothetical protein
MRAIIRVTLLTILLFLQFEAEAVNVVSSRVYKFEGISGFQQCYYAPHKNHEFVNYPGAIAVDICKPVLWMQKGDPTKSTCVVTALLKLRKTIDSGTEILVPIGQNTHHLVKSTKSNFLSSNVTPAAKLTLFRVSVIDERNSIFRKGDSKRGVPATIVMVDQLDQTSQTGPAALELLKIWSTDTSKVGVIDEGNYPQGGEEGHYTYLYSRQNGNADDNTVYSMFLSGFFDQIALI